MIIWSRHVEEFQINDYSDLHFVQPTRPRGQYVYERILKIYPFSSPSARIRENRENTISTLR